MFRDNFWRRKIKYSFLTATKGMDAVAVVPFLPRAPVSARFCKKQPNLQEKRLNSGLTVEITFSIMDEKAIFGGFYAAK